MLLLNERRDRDGAELDGLIGSIARGDKDALRALYEQTRTAVYGFALSIVRNAVDAEDILQDTYIHIFQAAAGYVAGGKPMAWILTIARNLATDRLRRGQKENLLQDESWQTLPHQAGGLSNEDRMVLRAILEQLPDDVRQIVLLHALSGLKHREIASLLHLPLATVLSKYHRAVKRLGKLWKEAE